MGRYRRGCSVIEGLLQSATAKLAEIDVAKVRKPRTNDASACLMYAARMARQHGYDWYVVPTFSHYSIGHDASFKASYGLGRGFRVTPDGKIYGWKAGA